MNRDKQFKIFTSILFVVFAVIVLRLIQLQIIEGRRYREIAGENAAKVIPILAPRGIIYDRNGKVLVSNRAVFAVYVLPSSLPVDKIKEKNVIARLSEIIGVPVDEIYLKIKKRRYQPFEPILIKDHLALETVTKLEERRSAMAGVAVQYRPVRYYPYGKLAAHVLGYVGEIEARELKRLRVKGYKLGDYIGKTGIEKQYDAFLRGVDGGKKVEVDVYGKPVRVVSSADPIPGNDLTLTLDLELQKVVEAALGNYFGASIVMDPRTGEILAMASRPVFDPQIFTEPIEAKTWKKVDNANHPFMNRALSAYPPGSVFKIVTLSAILGEGLMRGEETINCTGTFKLGNRIAKDWLKVGHGVISLLEGLVWSCDVVFYDIGLKAGVDLIGRYARRYGFGKKTAIDLPGERSGLIPTKRWKKKRFGRSWYKGDTLNLAIGQGYLQVTPLQVAVGFGTVATGERYRPYVAAKITARDGTEVLKKEPEKIAEVPLGRADLEKMKEALRQAVFRGTGVAAYVPGLPAAGKTGTAENHGKAHAWFVCFAPYDDPEIVIVNFIEHGEHGDKAPARIAGTILKWYKEHRLKKKYAEVKYEGQFIKHGNYMEPYKLRLLPALKPLRKITPTSEVE